MKNSLITLLLVTGLVGTLAVKALANQSRTQELFDFDWRFANGDVAGAEKPEFNDAQWQAVDLPHDFSIYGPFDEKAEGGMPNGFRPLGIGWYRKAFMTPSGLDGKRVWLELEGVYRGPKVWLNGVLVAERLNGYLGFACDITPYLKSAGQTNIVVVRADNSLPNTSRWYTGGGIYRHVWLVVAGDVHVTQHGTYVITPKIATNEALVNVQTEIANDSSADQSVTLTSEVLDANGKAVATAQSTLALQKGMNSVCRQEIRVPNPALWNLAHPTLYRLVSRVSIAGKATDVYETPFGIREIRVTPDGLFLNGKREFVKGLCIHHDLGCLGAAAFDRAIERRLQTMKEIGCNAVRLSHNPHAPALLDMCDRMGWQTTPTKTKD